MIRNQKTVFLFVLLASTAVVLAQDTKKAERNCLGDPSTSLSHPHQRCVRENFFLEDSSTQTVYFQEQWQARYRDPVTFRRLDRTYGPNNRSTDGQLTVIPSDALRFVVFDPLHMVNTLCVLRYSNYPFEISASTGIPLTEYRNVTTNVIHEENLMLHVGALDTKAALMIHRLPRNYPYPMVYIPAEFRAANTNNNQVNAVLLDAIQPYLDRDLRLDVVSTFVFQDFPKGAIPDLFSSWDATGKGTPSEYYRPLFTSANENILQPLFIANKQRVIAHVIARTTEQRAHECLFSINIDVANLQTFNMTGYSANRCFDPKWKLTGLVHDPFTGDIFVSAAQQNRSGLIIRQMNPLTLVDVQVLDVPNMINANNRRFQEYDASSLTIPSDDGMMFVNMIERQQNQGQADIAYVAYRTNTSNWRSLYTNVPADDANEMRLNTVTSNIQFNPKLIFNGNKYPSAFTYNYKDSIYNYKAATLAGELIDVWPDNPFKQTQQTHSFYPYTMPNKNLTNRGEVFGVGDIHTSVQVDQGSGPDSNKQQVTQMCHCDLNNEFFCCGTDLCNNNEYARQNSPSTQVDGYNREIIGRLASEDSLFTSCVELPPPEEFTKPDKHAMVIGVEFGGDECAHNVGMYREDKLWKIVRTNPSGIGFSSDGGISAKNNRFYFIFSPHLNLTQKYKVDAQVDFTLRTTTEVPLDNGVNVLKFYPAYENTVSSRTSGYPSTSVQYGEYRLFTAERTGATADVFFEVTTAQNAQQDQNNNGGNTFPVVGVLSNAYSAGMYTFAVNNLEKQSSSPSCGFKITSQFIDCDRPSQWALDNHLCCEAGKYCFPSNAKDVKGQSVNIQCPLGASCKGPRLLGDCSKGYTGYQCAQCELGYYALGSECFECSVESSVIRALVALLILAILLAIIGKFAKNTDSLSGIVTISLTFFQLTSLMIQMDIQWPVELEFVFNFFSVFNLNLNYIIAPECVDSSWNPLQDYMVYVSAPFLLFNTMYVLYVMNGLLVKCCNMSPMKRRMFSDASINIFTQFVSFGYVFLANQVLKIDDCERDPATGSYTTWNAYPSLLCYENVGPFSQQESDYNKMIYQQALGVAYLGIAVWVIGIPVTFFGAIKYYRSRLDEQKVYNRFGFLTNRFTEDHPFWEVFLLIRKLLSAMFVQLTSLQPTDFPQMQPIGMGIVAVIGSLSAVKARPFLHPVNNRMEIATNLSTAGLLVIGILAQSGFSTDPLISSILGWVGVLIILGTLIGLGHAIWEITKDDEQEREVKSTVPKSLTAFTLILAIIGTAVLATFVTSKDPSQPQSDQLTESTTRFWVTSMFGVGLIFLTFLYQIVKRQVFQKCCGCAYDSKKMRDLDEPKCCDCIECCTVCGCCRMCQEPPELQDEMDEGLDMDTLEKGKKKAKKGKDKKKEESSEEEEDDQDEDQEKEKASTPKKRNKKTKTTTKGKEEYAQISVKSGTGSVRQKKERRGREQKEGGSKGAAGKAATVRVKKSPREGFGSVRVKDASKVRGGSMRMK